MNCFCCKGSGEVDCMSCNHSGRDPEGDICSACNGRGSVTCGCCDGTGEMPDPEPEE